MSGEPRFQVQRSTDGILWGRPGAADVRRHTKEEADIAAAQLANRGRRGESFRVVDTDTGFVVFTVENPS